MNVEDLAGIEEFTTVFIADGQTPVVDGYCGDLLSDVMANAPAQSVLMTIQAHKNTIAVASLVGITALVICNGRVRISRPLPLYHTSIHGGGPSIVVISVRIDPQSQASLPAPMIGCYPPACLGGDGEGHRDPRATDQHQHKTSQPLKRRVRCVRLWACMALR